MVLIGKYSMMLFVILAVSACALGPDFKRPETKANTLSTFLNEGETVSDQNSMSRWWERIDDPLLPDYINVMLDQNLSLKEAGARVLQARARLGIERGNYYPSLSVNTSGSRSFTPGQAVGQDRQYSTNYAAELETSWEIDLFGRVRRSVESADAAFQASLYDREALAHSLIAELLNRRIAISVNQRLVDLAEQNAGNRQKIYNLVKNRYDLGAASTRLEDVLLAEENFTTVQADINSFQRSLHDQSYAFDVLLGQVPGTTDLLDQAFPIVPVPLDVPLCVPASLLDRRPDLRSDELRLTAANADIGVAIADLYPTINLGGTIGFTGDTTGGLFSGDQLAGSLVGSVLTRLFQGGALRANIDLQKAEAEELVHAYAGRVLEAVREVESALQAEKELNHEITSLNRSVDALRRAESVSEERYRAGIITLQDFLNTQQRLYQIEQTAILREQEKWDTRISLYLALGGDWFSKSKGEEACS